MLDLVNNCQTSKSDSGSFSVIIEHLTKLYPKTGSKQTDPAERFVTANNDISLSVQRGEIFGLLGPNGAGKTTLITQILGLTKPDFGSIVVEGYDVIANPASVRTIAAYLPQQGLGFDHLEVWRALAYTGQLRGLSAKTAQVQAKQLIQKLELSAVADRYISKLSGGMYRMVAFASALMGNPKLLVLDEPTNELDPVRRRLVWETLRTLKQEREITCLLVTHNVLEAETVLERLAILSEGKIVAQGTPGELKQRLSREAYIAVRLKDSFAQPELEFLQQLYQETFLAGVVRIEPEHQDSKKLRIYLPVERTAEGLSLLLHRLGMACIDDFKVALSSLEDVYFGFMQTKGVEEKDDVE